jgi:hypothetical protein
VGAALLLGVERERLLLVLLLEMRSWALSWARSGGGRMPCLVPRCAGKTPTQHACDTEINGCRRPLTWGGGLGIWFYVFGMRRGGVGPCFLVVLRGRGWVI